MGQEKGPQVSSDSEKWKKIFNNFVYMLQTQQRQLEFLVKERKLLENHIKMQHDRWVFDIRNFENQISQMKRDFVLEDMTRALETVKSDLVLGLKQREASFYKFKLEHADSELADFKQWFDYLSNKCSDPNEVSQGNLKKADNVKGRCGDNSNLNSIESTEEEMRRTKVLEDEVRRLKSEYDELSSKTSAEASALLLERDFVWNQYKTMESEYDDKLKSKNVEIEQANEKMDKLLASLEEMQSLNHEKDGEITKLKAVLAKMEVEKNQQNEEISNMSRKLEVLKNSADGEVVTPVMNHFTAELKTSKLRGKSSGRNRSVFVKREPTNSQVREHEKDSEKGSRSLKRKNGHDSLLISETSKLFSSSFKVPKLKNSFGRSQI